MRHFGFGSIYLFNNVRYYKDKKEKKRLIKLHIEWTRLHLLYVEVNVAMLSTTLIYSTRLITYLSRSLVYSHWITYLWLV